MATFQQSVLQKIKALKQQPFSQFTIPSSSRSHPIALRLVTYECTNDLSIIRLLSRWRKKHEMWFPSQFHVTPGKTKQWLTTQVIGKPDRLLFLIEINSVYRGHIGLYRFDFKTKSCEIDNIVRGKSGYKGMMEQSIRMMIGWGRRDLGISSYTLQTTSDNLRAIALYSRIGFIETKRIPLVYIKTQDGGEWVVAPEEYSMPIQRYDVYMTQKDL